MKKDFCYQRKSDVSGFSTTLQIGFLLLTKPKMGFGGGTKSDY
jgi:hypothetical protein